MKNIDYSKVDITGGFWKDKQSMVRSTTVHAVRDRFSETGRFDAFKCDWKEGMPNRPHFFWDSDVAKWIEGVAYLTKKKREPKLEEAVDGIVDLIEKNQGEDGYFNIYFTVIEPKNRFAQRDFHELYCAGHLTEAAIAYFEATGKRKFLDLMCRYADYIEKRFMIDKDTGFTTPGHEEIELALIKLWKCTGEKRYLELSKFFLNERGKRAEKNDEMWELSQAQSHLPVREQFEAMGHSVRATYLYTAMADMASESGDAELRYACERLFDDITGKKMYITGGIGSTSAGEAFTVPYDLPNMIAYTESCAAIGLAFFANSMLKGEANSKYSDTVERILYNGFLSSISLDGKSFFYENPLEIIPSLRNRDVSTTQISVRFPPASRQESFYCSCCPPNIVRFIASVANMLYSDDGETVYVHQFMQSSAEIERDGKNLRIEQTTRFPENGKIKLRVSGADTRVAVRIPWWADNYAGETVKGYAYFDMKDGEELALDFGMKIRLIEARPEVTSDCGRVAVMRGPVVYCTESIDNGKNLRDLRIDTHSRFATGKHGELGVPQIRVRAWRKTVEENAPLYSVRTDELVKTEAVLIPYYAFANRGECEMQVWHLTK